MINLFISSLVIGFYHALTPGHWLAISVLAKAKKWNNVKIILASTVVGLGHTLISVATSLVIYYGISDFLNKHKSELEYYSGLILIVFGAVYSLFHLRKEILQKSHKHTHSVEPPKNGGGIIFLFFLSLSPCLATLPIFTSSIILYDFIGVILASFSFILGVSFAISLFAILSLKTITFINKNLLTHYGDVFAGMVLMGLGFVLVISHAH